MSARVRAALDDARAGKVWVDDSLTALTDRLEAEPRLSGLELRAADCARRSLSRALESLSRAEKMLAFLLEQNETQGGTA